MKFYYDIVLMDKNPSVEDLGTHETYGHNLYNVTGVVEEDNEECARDAVVDKYGRPEYWEEFYEHTAV